jgi:hypothetical protein
MPNLNAAIAVSATVAAQMSMVTPLAIGIPK